MKTTTNIVAASVTELAGSLGAGEETKQTADGGAHVFESPFVNCKGESYIYLPAATGTATVTKEK